MIQENGFGIQFMTPSGPFTGQSWEFRDYLRMRATVRGSAESGIFAGLPSPNGSQTATGPAIYLQTTTSPPTLWFKVSPGTSNNEWA